MKVLFQALGCRLNEAELESWSNELVTQGHQVTTDKSQADVVVFNTCSVTGEADRKSRQMINRMHRSNPDSRLVVTGCYASLQGDALATLPGVDMVIDNLAKDDLVRRLVETYKPELEPPDPDAHPLFERGRQRAFIKVQDGCRYRCTFCIVTLARGEERSRSRQQIIDDINRHHLQGVQEVVLTGVHVGGYGSDSGDSLYRLLEAILDKTSMPRIRLASVEPWDLPDEFFNLFQDPRLMPHMHLPLQSGSDSVLRRMARRCKTRQFREIVEQARRAVDRFNVTTDIIVGFPGETEQEWRDTVDFVESVGFGHIHIFSYSPRSGTKAAGMPLQVAPDIKKARSEQLHDVAASLKQTALRDMLDQTCEVLWERPEPGGSGRWIGYTPNYHRILGEGMPGLAGSEIRAVSVSRVCDDVLMGQLRELDTPQAFNNNRLQMAT